MLTIFADPCILDECITLDVIFINRRGEEEAGRGSGLLRDLFSLFWKDVYQSLMVGFQASDMTSNDQSGKALEESL